MRPITRSLFCVCSALVCLWVMGVGQVASAEESSDAERITIDGLVSAAPVPEGFSVRKQDLKNGEEVVGHLLIVLKEGVRTAGIVQIERRTVATRAARVATLKAYVNAAADTWKQRGYAVKVKALPDFEKVDMTKPVIVELDATKEGQAAAVVFMKVFFDQFAFAVTCSSTDPAYEKAMIAWCHTVRPIAQDTDAATPAATPPAQKTAP